MIRNELKQISLSSHFSDTFRSFSAYLPIVFRFHACSSEILPAKPVSRALEL
jgi:hypothetical protein